MKWLPAFLSSKHGRWVLVVRSGGVRLFRGSRRAPGLIRDFAADESGYAELGRYLEHTAAPPIHLLVDVIEEDFRRETVPHVFGRTRQGVLATRRARLFHGTPYVSTRREGRAPEGRRDDRILFSAIVRPERIEPWLDVLREHEAPVAGIHSLPITSARLLPLLGANAGQVLLVTESGERDLRQTFFEDGRLALSRLAPLPPGKSGERARCIVAEVERFLHHLDRSGHSTEGLKIRFVGGAHLLAAMRALEIGGELAEGLVDTATVERRLGHRCRAGNNESDGGSDGGCDRMFARLALSRRPPNHYAPAAALAIHRSKQAARALKAAGIAMLLAGAAWSGSVWHRSSELAAAAEVLDREAHGYEVRYRAERLPESKVAARDVRLAVETARRLDTNRVRALPILRTISEALSGFPDLQLESLEWFEISDRDGWPDPRDPDTPRERFRVVHLRGRIEPFNGHYRAAADEVFRFADGLEVVPRLSEVEVTDLPLNPGGGGGYQHRQKAGFEMRMVLDVRAE